MLRPIKSFRGMLILGSLAVAGAAGFVLARRPFRVEVKGSSMEPTLHDGDWLVAFAREEPRTGDVVVLDHPQRADFELVKRLRGVPGETLPDGRVLAADEWWVEGDADESETTDSRSFGPVRRSEIKGRVAMTYAPRPIWFEPAGPAV